MPPAKGLRAYFGIPQWLLSYNKDWLRPDVIAGLTAAAVVIPKSMAYTSMAGLPLQVGLYAAFLPMVIYAFLGTSRVLSVSTTTTLAILTAAQLGAVVSNGDADSLSRASASLTVLVGSMLTLTCFLRLGFVAKETFLQSLLSTIRSVPETKLITLAVGVCMILILGGVEHFAPKVPAPLIAVAAGISGAYFLQLGTAALIWWATFLGDCPRLLPHRLD